MKYQLIGSGDFLTNPIETVLQNRGIDDIQSFLHIDRSCVIHWSKLKNMKEAVECFLRHTEKDSNIFIQVDSDADGFTSSALLINYLAKVFSNINITWRLHEGKQHGIIADTVPDDIDLVIVPDAGSNDYKQHKILKERGIDVIVLDHHDCEELSEDAIVVNSQLSPEYENKQFSGVGITYKFCKALDENLGINIADDYLDLVAVGNIADSMDMRSLETRYYVNKGLNEINNKLLTAIYEKQSFSTKGIVNITTTSFYVNPLINACIRVGTTEEKTQMMKAFLESDEKIYYKRNDEYEDIAVNTARMLTNVKNRQGRLRDKGVALIEEKIKEKNLLDNRLLIVNITGILDNTLTGLVANKLKDKYRRGTLLLRYNEKEKAMMGSQRGYEKGAIKDLKTFLLETGKFDFVEGHANASGVKIQLQNLIDANEIINERLKDVPDDDSHIVDFIMKPKQLTKKFIKDIHKCQDIWGYQVEEPLIAIKDIEVNSDEIYLNGKKSKTIKFIHKNIEYIKFFSSEEEYNDLVNQGECIVMDIVGCCSINEYQGKTTPQIVIEDYDVTAIKEKELIF